MIVEERPFHEDLIHWILVILFIVGSAIMAAEYEKDKLQYSNRILVERLYPNAVLPTKEQTDDKGWYLYAVEDKIIGPFTTSEISTGLSIQLQDNRFIKIVDESRDILKRGIRVVTRVIDSGYTGEIKILLLNYTDESISIKAGDKIARMIILESDHIEIKENVEFVEDVDGSR